ncbi:hypothetical protein [Sorangium sp. So ce363]|uniref:hypothetical protein n=1 Tax=Sorangium sp. So ce363 TaxID=3133304 RepID=UPI003F639201
MAPDVGIAVIQPDGNPAIQPSSHHRRWITILLIGYTLGAGRKRQQFRDVALVSGDEL